MGADMTTGNMKARNAKVRRKKNGKPIKNVLNIWEFLQSLLILLLLVLIKKGLTSYSTFNLLLGIEDMGKRCQHVGWSES